MEHVHITASCKGPVVKDLPQQNYLDKFKKQDNQSEQSSNLITSNSPVSLVLYRLRKVKQIRDQQWQALCPSHDDSNPSLSIGCSADGSALLHCHAGCHIEDIISAIGLGMSDLNSKGSTSYSHFSTSRTTGRNTTHTKTAKEIVKIYDYEDQERELLYQVVRYFPKSFKQRRPAMQGGWLWDMKDTKRVVYRLPEILDSEPDEWVFIVEGEKDADALARLELVATTNPGGAGKWKHLSDLSPFQNRKVAIIPDLDDPGRKHGLDVATRLSDFASEIRIVDLSVHPVFNGKDVSDFLGFCKTSSHTELVSTFLSMAKSFQTEEGSFWKELSPLMQDVIDTPRFPTETLPPWLKDMVEGVAEITQTPVGLAGSIALGTISLCCAGRLVIKPNPDWPEYPNLYIALALPSGARKSGAFRLMSYPVGLWERKQRIKLKQTNQNTGYKKKLLERRLSILEKDALKGDNQAEQEAQNLAATIDSMVIPSLPQLYTADVTPEGVERLLAEQKDGVGIFSSEGAELFSIIAGRYSPRGNANMEVFLKGHTGEELRVNRAARDREAIILPRTAITMVLCIQPSVLEDVWLNKDFRGRGLLARILFADLPNPMGSRDMDPCNIPESVKNKYNKSLSEILNRFRGQSLSSDPHVLTLDQYALDIFNTFRRRNEASLGPGGENEHMAPWASKLEGTAARIGGILHIASNLSEIDPLSVPISANTMSAALQLCQYFTQQQKKIQRRYGGTTETRMAVRILEYVRLNRLPSFSERDLYRALGVNKGETREPLELLEETNHIRVIAQIQKEAHKVGRKRSRTFEVNPVLQNRSVNSVNSVMGGE